MWKTLKLDDVIINYFEEESDAPKTLVLHHGFRGNAKSLFSLVLQPNRDYKIISIDGISHGDSSKIENTSLEMMADYFDKFIVAKKLTNYSILGHSLGAGVIALSKHKGNKNILLGPFNPYKNDFGKGKEERVLVDPKNKNEALTVYKSLVSKHFKNKNYMSMLDANASAMIITIESNKPYLDYLVNHQILNKQYLHSIEKDFKTLNKDNGIIIWGKDDKFIPEKSVDKLSLETGMEIIKLDGIGHVPVFENPRLINDLITKII